MFAARHAGSPACDLRNIWRDRKNVQTPGQNLKVEHGRIGMGCGICTAWPCLSSACASAPHCGGAHVLAALEERDSSKDNAEEAENVQLPRFECENLQGRDPIMAQFRTKRLERLGGQSCGVETVRKTDTAITGNIPCGVS